MANQTVSPGWDTELVPTAAGDSDEPDPACPVEEALHAISGRWTTLILRNLMSGSRSFSGLASELPRLSDKVLSDRLTVLLRLGLIDKDVSAGFPNRTSYRLTARGRQLRPLLIELYQAGLRLQATDNGAAGVGCEGVKR